MTHVVNTLYSILTWIATFTIGFDGWLGWALLGMAILQSWGTLLNAVREL